MPRIIPAPMKMTAIKRAASMIAIVILSQSGVFIYPDFIEQLIANQ